MSLIVGVVFEIITYTFCNTFTIACCPIIFHGYSVWSVKKLYTVSVIRMIYTFITGTYRIARIALHIFRPNSR